MTSYQNKYLEMLKTDFGKKPLREEPSKPSKIALRSSRIILRVLKVRRIGPFQNFHLPYDAEGVPCGGCPNCNQGEFWRRPKFHKDHNPTGWVCWFCSPPLRR